MRTIGKVSDLVDGILWPYEVYFAQMIIRSIIDHKGRLEMGQLGSDIAATLAGEKRLEAYIRSPQTQTVINLADLSSGWIGGPGPSAHSVGIGLKNHNNLGANIEDMFQAGLESHSSACAVSGGIIVSAATGLAVNEGENPEAIWHQLNVFIDHLPKGFKVPGRLMKRLDIVGDLLRQNIPTEKGIKQLQYSSDWLNKTALGVIPLSFFIAYNRPNSFKSLIKILWGSGIDNYKVWMITAMLGGAMVGIEGIPDKWIGELPYNQVIINNARELYQAIEG